MTESESQKSGKQESPDPDHDEDGQRENTTLFSEKFTSSTKTESTTRNEEPEPTPDSRYNINNSLVGLDSLNNPPKELLRTLTKDENRSLISNKEDSTRAEFSLTINVDLLNSIIHTHTPYTTNTVCSITQDGIFTRGLSSDKTRMVATWVNTADLKNYSIDTPGVFTINWNDLSDAIKGSQTDNIDISCETNTVDNEIDQEITISESNKSESITAPSFEDTKRTDNIPSIESDLRSSIRFSVEELKTIIKRFDDYSGIAQISATENGVLFKDDSGTNTIKKEYTTSGDIITHTGENSEFHTNTDTGQSTLFSIRLWKPLFKSMLKADLDNSCEIKFGTENPIFCTISHTQKSYSRYMTAPRVDS